MPSQEWSLTQKPFLSSPHSAQPEKEQVHPSPSLCSCTYMFTVGTRKNMLFDMKSLWNMYITLSLHVMP